MAETTDGDGLTVGQTSARLGVTVRALHHWDEIGLARPSLRTAAGYRLYTAGDLERLHRVVVYRELGLSLDRIRAVIDDAATDVPGALRARPGRRADRPTPAADRRTGPDDRRPRARPAPVHRGADRDLRPPLGPGRPGQGPPPLRGHPAVAAVRGTFRLPHPGGVAGRRRRHRRPRPGPRGGDGRQASPPAALGRTGSWSGTATSSPRTSPSPGRCRSASPACTRAIRGSPPTTTASARGWLSWFRRLVDADARAHGIDPDMATWDGGR